jgi:hypothetical protein
MNTKLAALWIVRAAASAGMVLCATVVARADGPVPDPPVPAEAIERVHLAALDREPDCRCAVLHARDIESRVDGHVERYEQQQSRASARHHDKRARALHGTSFVEGVTGFPVRQFRLASDLSDDGAGTP